MLASSLLAVHHEAVAIVRWFRIQGDWRDHNEDAEQLLPEPFQLVATATHRSTALRFDHKIRDRPTGQVSSLCRLSYTSLLVDAWRKIFGNWVFVVFQHSPRVNHWHQYKTTFCGWINIKMKSRLQAFK